MIDREVTDHLMEFYLNSERRAARKQILPAEGDKHLINKACQKGLLTKLTAGKGKGAKGDRASGYRFTELGSSLMFLLVKEEEANKKIDQLKRRVGELEAVQVPELSVAVQKTASDEVVDALKEFPPNAWKILIGSTEDPRLSAMLRRLYVKLARYVSQGVHHDGDGS